MSLPNPSSMIITLCITFGFMLICLLRLQVHKRRVKTQVDYNTATTPLEEFNLLMKDHGIPAVDNIKDSDVKYINAPNPDRLFRGCSRRKGFC